MYSIAPSLLQHYGASLNHFRKSEYIFHEDRPAHFYFQLEEGTVKMFNSGETCDFIQGLFANGESFGEPALLGDFPYPADARALADSKIWVLKKANFIQLLKENPVIHLELTQVLCKRLCYKTKILTSMTTQRPEDLILTIIDHFKNKSCGPNQPYEVPFTRQTLADLTGLRVETVIRKVKQLADKGELQLHQQRVLRIK
jgi:CRP-like cAMP-binding protein